MSTLYRQKRFPGSCRGRMLFTHTHTHTHTHTQRGTTHTHTQTETHAQHTHTHTVSNMQISSCRNSKTDIQTTVNNIQIVLDKKLSIDSISVCAFTVTQPI